MASAVTLRVRVWIETIHNGSSASSMRVTLRVRVWIETDKSRYLPVCLTSHPPREGVD